MYRLALISNLARKLFLFCFSLHYQKYSDSAVIFSSHAHATFGKLFADALYILAGSDTGNSTSHFTSSLLGGVETLPFENCIYNTVQH